MTRMILFAQENEGKLTCALSHPALRGDGMNDGEIRQGVRKGREARLVTVGRSWV